MHKHNPRAADRVSRQGRTGLRPSRRGAVMLYGLVCLLLLSLIGASLLKLSTAQRHQVRREQWRMQAAWLAEAGIERAAAHLAADRDYSGETWELSAEDVGGVEAALVRIEVDADEADRQIRTIAVSADYPTTDERRARVSKHVLYRFDVD